MKNKEKNIKTKLSRDGLFAVCDINNEYIIRFFDNEESYKKWVEYTNAKGHDMTSFYMIRKMRQQYHEVTNDEFKSI